MTVESTGSGIGLKKSVMDSSYKTEYDENIDILDEVVNRVGKNLLINGNPLINQRGYVSGAATTGANEYTLDRWRVVTSGQSLTFSTTANVVTMTLPVGGIEQVIEGLNIQSGTHVISFVATGDTVCTVDGVTKASGGTFTLTGGTNATVKFSSASGTGTVKLIQVERGSVATEFEYRPVAEELALCQRYYERVHTGFGTAQSAVRADMMISFQPKRVQPTLGTTGALTVTDAAYGNFLQSSASASWLYYTATGSGMVNCGNFSGMTTARPTHLRNTVAGGAYEYFTLDSEL